MSKKIISIILALVLCLAAIFAFKWYCGNKVTEEPPLKLIDEVVDQYGNILQQTFYNEETGDYMLREYTYALQRNKWVCTNQQMTIIPYKEETINIAPTNNVNTNLKIYYNSDLVDGPITIMDNEYAKISIVKYLAKDNWWEFGYELKVVNKTNSVITIMIDSAAIMDISCKPLFSVDHIDAGNTAYFTLAWDRETLERCYIPYIDNIEFMIRVFDNENWKTPALAGSRVMLKK